MVGYFRKLKSFLASGGAIVPSTLLTLLIIFLIINPDRYIQSVYYGLTLFATSVAPALFPFFFFSRLLTGLGMADTLGSLLRRPISALYNAPGAGGYVCCMGIISGYPVGAKLLGELYDGGALNAKQVNVISSFTSTSGPLFVVGTVATVMFKSTSTGYILLAVHFVSALLNGFIYRGKKSDAVGGNVKIRDRNMGALLSESMLSSITSLLAVGGYIAVFSMISDVLEDIGLIGLIARGLQKCVFWQEMPLEMARGVAVSLVEVTKGCRIIADCNLPLQMTMPWVALALSFGGISIGMQSLTFLSACKISWRYHFATKITQSLISFVLMSLIALLL